MGFRLPHYIGYHSAPTSYQRHYHYHDSSFHRQHHYLGYSTHQNFLQRYPPVHHHHHSPSSSIVRASREGVELESPSVQDVAGENVSSSSTSLSKRESKRNEALPLKKRKLIDFAEKEAISVDNQKTENNTESTVRDWDEEEHYARGSTTTAYHHHRGPSPYPPYYHYNYSHFYSPYPVEVGDDNYPPMPSSNHHYHSHGRNHHHDYVQHPPRERQEHHHPHQNQQRFPVSPADEDCSNSNDESNETQVEEQEQSSRIDDLAAAADTLEMRSETPSNVKLDDDDVDEDCCREEDDDNTTEAYNHKKCVPVCSSMLTQFLRKNETTTAATSSLPAFAEIVNFPEYLPPKGSPSKESNGKQQNSRNEQQPSKKRCVMCGITCIFAGSTPSKRNARKNLQNMIPKQNKGLCNSCDGKTWIYSDAPIKWCKGCKNFRLLTNFGDKYRATKCVRCRERQRENYEDSKRKANMLVTQKTGGGSDESERGSPELDAAMGLASLC